MDKFAQQARRWLLAALILIVPTLGTPAKPERKVRWDLVIQGKVVAKYVAPVDLVKLTTLPNVETLIVRIEKLVKGRQQSEYIKVRYQYWEGEPALPDSILNPTKRWRFSLRRDRRCDSSLQDMKGPKPETGKGTPAQLPYLKFTDETERLADDTHLTCYSLTPNNYRAQE